MAKNFVVLDTKKIGPKGVASPRAITVFKTQQVISIRSALNSLANFDFCYIFPMPAGMLSGAYDPASSA